MKRFLALVLLLCVWAAPAMAEGKHSVTQKNYYVLDSGYSIYGYLYAKVENIGDEPIILDSGKLVIFDADDNILETANYITPYPRYLAPGDHAYVREWSLLDEDAIGDYKFSVTTTERDYEVVRLDCEASYDPGKVDSKYDNYVYVTFTNPSEEIIYGAYFVFALLDGEGNILFMNDDTASGLGVHPGSTITVRFSVESIFVDYFAENSITPATVDALVYYEIED